MTLLIASGEITTPGTTGAVVYSGVTTFTPKVILFFSNTYAAGAGGAGAYRMVGAASAALAMGNALWAEANGLAAANSVQATHNNNAIIINDSNAASTHQAATLTAVSSTGFTLNWSVSDDALQSVQWLALGGQDLSVKVGQVSTGTGTSNIATTGLTFMPKVVLFFSSRIAVATGFTVSDSVGRFSFGAAVDATHRWSTATASDDNDATIDTAQVVFNDNCNFTFSANQATNGILDFVSMDADGFTVVPDDAYTADMWIHYVALGGASLSAAVGTDTQKGSTGTQAKTGIGFPPEALLFCGNGAVTLGTVAAGISSSMGVAHGSSNRATAVSDDDNVADTACGGSTSASKCIRFVTGATPTTVAEASLSSLDNDGYTLTWPIADATVRLFGFVALAFTTTVTITSNGGGATASVSVAENTTAVTTVVATTTGEGITYSITGGADQAKFSIGSSTGVLTFTNPPDFEVPSDANTDNDYVVEVTATSGSSTDAQVITVTVTDVNDPAVGGGAGIGLQRIGFGL